MVIETKSLYSCRANQPAHEYITNPEKAPLTKHFTSAFLLLILMFIFCSFCFSFPIWWCETNYCSGGSCCTYLQASCIKRPPCKTPTTSMSSEVLRFTHKAHTQALSNSTFRFVSFPLNKYLIRKACTPFTSKKDACHSLQITEFPSLWESRNGFGEIKSSCQN